MAPTDRLAQLAPYTERLLDDYVYAQLDDAVADLRAAYDRLSGRSARRALDDRKLHRRLERAATSLRNAVLKLQGEPPKTKSRLPRLLVFGAAVGAAAWLSRDEVRDLFASPGETDPVASPVMPAASPKVASPA